jgi:hypothetical protein
LCTLQHAKSGATVGSKRTAAEGAEGAAELENESFADKHAVHVSNLHKIIAKQFFMDAAQLDRAAKYPAITELQVAHGVVLSVAALQKLFSVRRVSTKRFIVLEVDTTAAISQR